MFPKVNQNIFIDIVDQEHSCRSIIADITEKEVMISSPSDANVIGELVAGTPLRISFVTNDNQYRFGTEVLGVKKDAILLYRLKKPREQDVIKIQRREDFRVSASLPVTLNGQNCTSINISSGGILLSCSPQAELPTEEIFTGTFMLPSVNKVISKIDFDAQVIRTSPSEDGQRQTVALKFVHLGQSDQMKILQFCFEKQRQMRLKQR
ncbi:flagellar brake protein [Bacillus sp. EB01]|uniref:flagellar brake protein n=1 Tax=Bacillus sp. EB01 TaxID=1347086 RepID=UPI0005C797F1|nr:PilZ domain-containing protein [Bacillus sp. EB01]